MGELFCDAKAEILISNKCERRQNFETILKCKINLVVSKFTRVLGDLSTNTAFLLM